MLYCEMKLRLLSVLNVDIGKLIKYSPLAF